MGGFAAKCSYFIFANITCRLALQQADDGGGTTSLLATVEHLKVGKVMQPLGHLCNCRNDTNECNSNVYLQTRQASFNSTPALSLAVFAAAQPHPASGFCIQAWKSSAESHLSCKFCLTYFAINVFIMPSRTHPAHTRVNTCRHTTLAHKPADLGVLACMRVG